MADQAAVLQNPHRHCKDRGIFQFAGAPRADDPKGKGNPNLYDQTMLHANNELKRIDMSPDDVERSAVSTTRLDY